MHILAYLCTCAYPGRPSAHSRQGSMLSCTIQAGDRTKMMELSYGTTTKSQSGEALPCTYHMCAGARPRTYHECLYIYKYIYMCVCRIAPAGHCESLYLRKRDPEFCRSSRAADTLKASPPPSRRPEVLSYLGKRSSAERSLGHYDAAQACVACTAVDSSLSHMPPMRHSCHMVSIAWSQIIFVCGSSADYHISCCLQTTHPQATIYGNPFVSVHDRQAHSGPRKGWIHMEVHQERLHCTTIAGSCIPFLHTNPVSPSVGICCGAEAHHVREMAVAVGKKPIAMKYMPDMSKHFHHGTDKTLKKVNKEIKY